MEPNSSSPIDTSPHRMSRKQVLRAVILLSDIIGALGHGRHTFTCAASRPTQGPLVSLDLALGDDGIGLITKELSLLVYALAAAFRPGCSVGLVVRSHHQEDERDVLRGWVVAGGRVRPLTAEQIERAYSTDLLTGEPLPPDPDTIFRPGIPLSLPGEAKRKDADDTPQDG